MVGATGPLIVPPLVVAETCYLISTHLGHAAEAAFLDSVSPGGSFELGDFVPADAARASELVRRYADLRIGGTDASVIAFAERVGAVQVTTVDRRHFSIVRPRHVDALTLLPEKL